LFLNIYYNGFCLVIIFYTTLKCIKEHVMFVDYINTYDFASMMCIRYFLLFLIVIILTVVMDMV
jgi:hypothetical protein